MGDHLKAGDYRRLLAVVEVAGRHAGTAGYRAAVLMAPDEHLGYRGSAFFLAGPPEPGFQALDGVLHGYAQRGLEEYATSWSDREPFGRPNALAQLRRGHPVAFDEIYRRGAEHRDYADFWLRPQRIAGYMLVWLDTGLPSHGYISLLSDHAFGSRDRALLSALRPHLAAWTRRSLPDRRPGLLALSKREREIVFAVAAGDANSAVAKRLGVTEDTVKKHVSRAMARLRVRSRTQLALVVGHGPDDSTFVQ